MTWCCGDSEGERFASARAFYVACHQKQRRPDETLQGFQMALARLPMGVLRALAAALRQQLAPRFIDTLRIGKGGYVPLGCDGSRLECPRAQELQARLGEAGKPESAPTVYVSALVLLPLGLLWSWCLGKGTASEHDQMRRLLSTLPPRALLVADAFYQGYELYAAIVAAEASFLVRLSSRTRLYKEGAVRLERFRQGLVYYWPEKTAQDKGKPPLRLRLLRVRGPKADVWLLTNVLDPRDLNHRQIGQLYRWRWRNERVFQQVTDVFPLKRLIGGSPQAGIFQLAFCLLLYNMIQVLRAYVAAAEQWQPDDISLEKLFDDVERELTAWSVLVQPADTVAAFAAVPSVAQVKRRLTQLLKRVWQDRWLKAVNEKPRSHRARPKATRSHTSVHRILEEHRRQQKAKQTLRL